MSDSRVLTDDEKYIQDHSIAVALGFVSTGNFPLHSMPQQRKWLFSRNARFAFTRQPYSITYFFENEVEQAAFTERFAGVDWFVLGLFQGEPKTLLYAFRTKGAAVTAFYRQVTPGTGPTIWWVAPKTGPGKNDFDYSQGERLT